MLAFMLTSVLFLHADLIAVFPVGSFHSILHFLCKAASYLILHPVVLVNVVCLSGSTCSIELLTNLFLFSTLPAIVIILLNHKKGERYVRVVYHHPYIGREAFIKVAPESGCP